MRYIIAISAILCLSSCVSDNPYAEFTLVKIPQAPGCSIIYDGREKMIRRDGNDPRVFGIGAECPKKLPNDESIRIAKFEHVKVSGDGRYAVLDTYNDDVTKTFWRLTVRKNTPGRGSGVGRYRWMGKNLPITMKQ